MAKSDLIIAELNITIEDLREYNTKLEHDIHSKEGKISTFLSKNPLLFIDGLIKVIKTFCFAI